MPRCPRTKVCSRTFELDGNLADSSGHYHDGRALKAIPTFSDGPVGNCVELTERRTSPSGNIADFDRADRPLAGGCG